jgi:outer membrane protein OmpA-like peptidoglycan-associated protein
MAHLEVQPKKANSWWLWLLIAIVVIGLVIYLARGSNEHAATIVANDTINDQVSSGAAAPAAAIVDRKNDWDHVNLDAPPSTDQDIKDKDISVRGTDHYTVYTVGENLLFAKGQDKLQASADQKLKQVTTSINRRYKGSTIGILGNTDSTGEGGKNTLLGAKRAMAVKHWLVSNGGLDSAKVMVRSFGETKPVASNATEKGRQQNRNVQIVAFADSASND